MTFNEKSIFKNSKIECVKEVKLYFIGLKNDLFGCFRIEGDRDKDNETGLKEGGGIEMSTTVLHSRAALSLDLLTFN